MKEKISQYLKKENSKNFKLTKKARFRLECIKRSSIFKEFCKLSTIINPQKISRIALLDYILEHRERFGKLTEFFCMAAVLDLKFDRDDLACFFLDLPSIEVLIDYSNHEALAQKFIKPLNKLKHEMRPNSSYRDLMFGWDPVIEKDDTISIRINLNRRRKDIVDDVTCLLEKLEKYGKYRNPDNRRRLEGIEKYFRAYDLREQTDGINKKKGWKEIAWEMIPEEAETDMEAAKSKVRYYYNEVKRYIQNEEWRM